MKLPAIHPKNYFFAFAQTLSEDLGELGIMRPDAKYEGKRRVLVGALKDARPVPGMALTYDPHAKLLESSNTVMARFWLQTTISGKPVYLFCRVETGSPANWQKYTLIVTQATTDLDHVAQVIRTYAEFRDIRRVIP